MVNMNEENDLLRSCLAVEATLVGFLLCVAHWILCIFVTAANKSSAIMSTHIVACLLLYRHRQVNLAVYHFLCTTPDLATVFLFSIFLLSLNFLHLIFLPSLPIMLLLLCRGGQNVTCLSMVVINASLLCVLSHRPCALAVGLCPLQAHSCKWVGSNY